ncbi:probable inactive receptor kinase At5g10020 isoform X2 [Diospyros lotus]|uniref:probable inactive receptor kinase At5g10020 isoform X2 n=1 Tax=Diospyros lotus TaxID=55363 RepID=UPI00225C089C|nr:probable inactive receptor kinase At5g10020 isoform X2 [Diospyros lotus]
MQAICLAVLLLVELAKGESDVDALLELKKGVQKDPSGKLLASWDSKSLASDGCPHSWYGISCSMGSVTSIALNDLGLVGDFNFPAISGLKMLSNISIANNHLTGSIPEQVAIESLEYLDASCNLFNGPLPPGLTNSKNLVLLNLSSNNFEGTVPSGFGKVKQLKYLDLRSNRFTGDIMDLLSQLGGVVHVDLSSNKFIGSLDLGLGSSSLVSSIQYLNISHNNLTGELFPHDGMPYFDSLEVFDGSYNQFVGTVPSFNFIVSLQILRLGSNQLSGSLPKALLQESSTVLSELDLSFNQLEGPVASITSATLENVNLSFNKISGTFPNQTSQFLRLTSFKISNNSLEGVLSPVLGTYSELKVIDFSLNRLSGFLLPSLFNSTRLTSLNLSYNNLTGPIPLQPFPNTSLGDSVQNLSLVYLDLSYNSLTGHLPPEIREFDSMSYLNLSNNDFDGGIPSDLPDNLKIFDVSRNNLSGVLPENLHRFPDSSFHPGNSQLIFPYAPSSPTRVPSITMRGHRSHKKSVIKAALIAGLVGGASTVVLVAIMIYYRTYQQENRKNNFKRDGESKGTLQEICSPAHPSSLHKNVDPSTSFNFPHSHMSSSELGSAHERRGPLSVIQRPKDLGQPQSMGKNEGLFSPTSLVSSTNVSPSLNQDLIDTPGFNVCSPDKLAGDLHLFDDSLVFTAEELSCAPAEVFGRSCHGTLYKAVLDSGYVLVVKWLKEGIAKGKKEFAREAKKLGSIKHPNLVSLQGYYWGPKEHEKLILSNYINAPSLAFYLHDPRKLMPLSLDERLKVAVDVAGCLNYLHNERAIPHGNLKSTNILIETPGPNALLTDYSLHRLMTPAGTAEQVLNAGALGYRPPEFSSTSKPCPSLKSDVYAFGVILLELLTGRSSAEIVSGYTRVVELTEWVRLLAAENRTIECFDKLILGTHNVEHQCRDLDNLLWVALRCVLPASERPDMKTVFDHLSSLSLEQAATR